MVELPAAEVVPGDLVAVAQGDRVPADVRVLHATALRTQEAALTGESAPVDKQPSPVASGAPLAERRSVLYAGTVVAAGSGEGVVVATGTDTELGRISALLEQADELTTPLTRELDRVGRAITARHRAWRRTGIAVVAALRGFPPATPRWPASAWRSPPSPRGCLRWSRSRWRSASSGWRGAGRSSATCRRSRRSAAPPSSPPTRPAR